MGTFVLFGFRWDDPSLNADLTPGMGLAEVLGRLRQRPRLPGRNIRHDHRRCGADITEVRQKSASSRRPDRADPEAIDVVLQT